MTSLEDVTLRHASVGLVGQAIVFSVENFTNPHLLHFMWNWGDRSSSEKAGSTLSHTFHHPGKYFITVNITSAVDNVVLAGHVSIQHRLSDLRIRHLAVMSSNLLLLEFEILQGDNVTYSLEYGDDSGEKIIRAMNSWNFPQQVSKIAQASSKLLHCYSLKRLRLKLKLILKMLTGKYERYRPRKAITIIVKESFISPGYANKLKKNESSKQVV